MTRDEGRNDMDILEASTDWARAELLSNGLFLLFGTMFVVGGLCLSRQGGTEMARAFVVPTLVAGVLLVILGGGLLFGTWKHLSGFDAAIARDAAGFVAAETARVEATMAQYATAVFSVMPVMTAVFALMIVVLHGPGWRAALITAIVFLGVVMLVDSTARARLAAYKDRLLQVSSVS